MRWLTLFLPPLAIFLVGCDMPGFSSPKATPVRLPTYTPIPAAANTAVPGVKSAAIPTLAVPPTLALDTTQVKKELAEVEAQTAKMRGLTPKVHVPEHFVSAEQMKYNLAQETLKNYTVDQAQLDATTLWLLLLIDDRSTDFRQLEVEFEGDAVLGYYDHNKKD